MSFSVDVKSECARVAIDKDCCKLTETIAFLRTTGKLLLTGKNAVGVTVMSSNASIVRRYYNLIKGLANCDVKIVTSKGQRLKKAARYELILEPRETNLELLKLLGMWDQAGYIFVDGKLKHFIRRQCCRRAFFRGIFLGGGSISSPKRDYHLEIALPNEHYAKLAIKAFAYSDIKGKIIERKDNYLLYIKEAEAIIDFLRFVGASNALLLYENERLLKDMRNRINREVNCETANLNKSVTTATRQIEKIKTIARNRGLDSLPAALKLTAEARLNNPEATIGELVGLLDDVSKSGVNHRLRRLEQIADEIREM